MATQLSFPARLSQQDRVLNLLRSKEWITLPEILDLRIANFRGRISELRQAGYAIHCEKQRVNGQLRTRYKLLGEPE
jgi:hypothetical protein